MTRGDAQFDAMLRHLGAAYYQTMHGDGTASDVASALRSAEAADGRDRLPGNHVRPPHHGRWRVSDVMTTSVVTVPKDMPYKQVARVMTEQRVNAVPVLTGDGRVAGIVSEADVLRKEERAFRRLGTGLPRRTRRERVQARARCAEELMTTPVITIHPDAPIGAAARLMNGHRIRRLPVVDQSGQLLGIVSRRDLLSVFLRDDGEIAAEVHGVLTGLLLEEPGGVDVTVRDGVVILTGTLVRPDLIPVAECLAEGVDGVVAVICNLTLGTPRDRSPSQHVAVGGRAG
ncbi:MAG TPA: CBS domain-containing protein [Streptosporangiaceae bacterium]|nr:CBS domain-containing protein [Streptosporangiaceae bacterium]